MGVGGRNIIGGASADDMMPVPITGDGQIAVTLQEKQIFGRQGIHVATDWVHVVTALGVTVGEGFAIELSIDEGV